jgi:lysocardiolipin and lysophospholipid acyltransferase
LLHPRETGFNHILGLIKPHSKAIYDVTIGFPDLIPQNEKLLIRGTYPKEVHFHVQRYEISELPENTSKWLSDLWAKKEENLRRFYTETKNFNFLSNNSTRDAKAVNVPLQLFIALVFWSSFLAFIFYLLYTSTFARYYFLLSNIMFITFTKLGGLEKFEIRLCKKTK